PFDAADGAAEQVERFEDDVVLVDGDGRSFRDHAGELALGRAGEGALIRGEVVDEEHAAEGDEALEAADLALGERGYVAVAAPHGEGFGEEGGLVGADGGGREAGRGRGAVRELFGPAGGCGGADALPACVAREQDAGVERALVAERADLARERD